MAGAAAGRTTMTGITWKLALWLMSLTLLVILVVGGMEYHAGHLAIATEMVHASATIADRLESNLGHSVYQFDGQGIQNSILSEFPNPELKAVLVWTPGRQRLLCGLSRERDGVIPVLRAPSDPTMAATRRTLFAKGGAQRPAREIGEIEVYVDPAIPSRALHTQLLRTFVKLILTALLLGYTFSFVANRYLAAPLEALRRRMQLAEQRLLAGAGARPTVTTTGTDETMHSAFAEVRQVGDMFQHVLDAVGQHQKQIAEDERRYRAIVDAFDGLIYICSRDLRVEFMNQRLIERTGRNAVGEPCYKVLHDLDAPCPWCVNDKVFAGEVVKWEVQSPKDHHWYYVVNTPIHHADGTLSKQAMIQDITERKLAEAKLRESEDRYRMIFNTANDAVFVTRLTVNPFPGRFTEVNDVACRRLGYSRAELLNMTAATVMDPATPADLAPIVERLFGAGTAVFETVHIAKDGTRIPVEISSHRFSYKDEDYVLSIARDLTDRERADQALRESEERYRSIVLNSPMGMHLYELKSDNRLVFIGANPAAERLLRVSHQAFIGKTIEEAFPALTGTEVPDRYRLAARDGVPWGTQQIEYRDDRIQGAFEVSAFQSSPGRMVAMFFDITDRKKGEDELRKYREHLEELVRERTAEIEAVNRELESFAYSVSHDLRAPLRSMDGFSQALLEDYPGKLDESGRDFLTRIRSGAQNMGQLIDSLLQLSRTTRGEFGKERVNLSDVVTDIVRELVEADPGRKVQWKITPRLIARGDPRLLRIALSNLLSNAVKFTAGRDPATIEFGTLMTEEAATRWESRFPVFFVRDNGAGFDMAYAGKLFGAFQRLHRRDEFPGTGIGLATVQRIVHRHGGRVWAEGVVGGGATFYFTLQA